METVQQLIQDYGFWVALAILALGVVLGFTKTIVVYRDYADLAKVFMLVLAPVGILLIAMQFGAGSDVWARRIKILVGILEVGLLGWILVSTFSDNRNILKTLLAFVTKIPLGVLFAFYVIQLILPGGKNYKDRRQSRGIAALIMLVLSPLLYGLVQHRVWSYRRTSEQEE